jgi:cobalamin synthase
MLLKGIAIAALDSQGMVQTIIVLVIEASLLILLLWSRPFERRSGNVINIIIQVVRVLSIVCILVFVEEFGIEQTTQTITGIVLIVVQSTLTGILAILIAWNAINACCKANPHRQRRKEMGT